MLLDIIPITQSTALLGDNFKFSKKKKKKTEDFMSQGIKNITGISLMKETANIIEDF